MQERSLIEKHQKTNFFGALGARSLSAYRLHKTAGLFEADWRNVPPHCLVEQGRVLIFSQKFGFSEDLTTDLLYAAAAHDFFKSEEKKILEANGLSWESYEQASQEATLRMQQASEKHPEINPRVIRLANAVGHGSLKETQSILDKSNLSEEDIAFLVMHYVDDYTRGDQWVIPAELDSSGILINEVDRRMDKNESSARYRRLNEQGKEHFNGETAFQAQRRIGHSVEERLAALLAETGHVVLPRYLPEFIDKELQNTIETTPVRHIITREEATIFGREMENIFKSILSNNLRFKYRKISVQEIPTANQQEYTCHYEENMFVIQNGDRSEELEATLHPSGLLHPEDYTEIRYKNTVLTQTTQEIRFGIEPESPEKQRWMAGNFAVKNFDTHFISLFRYAPKKEVLQTLPVILDRIQKLIQSVSLTVTPHE